VHGADRLVCLGAAQLRSCGVATYYFPFGTKRVPYTQIKGLQRIEITGLWSGKWHAR
jgi:hypothetical protein